VAALPLVFGPALMCARYLDGRMQHNEEEQARTRVLKMKAAAYAVAGRRSQPHSGPQSPSGRSDRGLRSARGSPTMGGGGGEGDMRKLVGSGGSLGDIGQLGQRGAQQSSGFREAASLGSLAGASGGGLGSGVSGWGGGLLNGQGGGGLRGRGPAAMSPRGGSGGANGSMHGGSVMARRHGLQHTHHMSSPNLLSLTSNAPDNGPTVGWCKLKRVQTRVEIA